MNTEAAPERKVPYEMLGGEEGVRALAREFYNVMDQLEEAETIRNMHNENLEEIQEKLYMYLSGWLGGPGLYVKETGSICLTQPHAAYPIGEAERDQWLLCMEKALENRGVSEELREMLRQPFFNVANIIRNTD